MTFCIGKIKNNSKGFTIIELLIATIVFSMVLLLVTTGVLEVTSVYFKGVTDSNTQTVATNILNTVSQAIEFDGGTVQETGASSPPGTSYVFCVGDVQFSYYPGYQLVGSGAGTDQTYHSLAEDIGGSGCAPQNMAGAPGSVTGRELMGDKMRLAAFSVTCALPSGICNGAPGTVLAYKVHVRVVYGDNNLLKSTSNLSQPNSVQATEPDAECAVSESGTQFCSESDLSTVVVMRVQ